MTVETATRAPFLASDRQRNFLRTLATERNASPTLVNLVAVLVEREDFTKAQATEKITELMALPYRPRERAAATTGPTVHELVAPAFFAIPTSQLSGAARREAEVENQTLVFGEVRAGREGRNYMDTVKGAPGSWNRTRQTPRTRVHQEIVKILARDQKAAMDLFGKEYTVCGKCASPLSDDVSRTTGYGPTCRKALGI